MKIKYFHGKKINIYIFPRENICNIYHRKFGQNVWTINAFKKKNNTVKLALGKVIHLYS